MKTKINNLILVVIILLLAAYLSFDFKEKQNTRITSSTTQTSVSDTNISVDDQNKIMQAYQQQRSNIQVQAQGIVKAVLPDDNQGLKHQKIILKLENGLKVLIAHNIDLAPRIDGLKKGDQLEFFGEYEYNPKGGVIHWTHHDPQRKHIDGWLKYKGKIYQ